MIPLQIKNILFILVVVSLFLVSGCVKPRPIDDIIVDEPEKDTQCEKISNQAERDICYEKRAIEAEDQRICEQISDANIQNQCTFIVEEINAGKPCKMINACASLFGVKSTSPTSDWYDSSALFEDECGFNDAECLMNYKERCENSGGKYEEMCGSNGVTDVCDPYGHFCLCTNSLWDKRKGCSPVAMLPIVGLE